MSVFSSASRSELKTGLAIPARLGAFASLLLLVSVFAWMQFTMISGAVIASGQIVVRGKPKQVQSLDGGVVEDIFVEDGDVVKKGDVLLRLDPSLLQINLDIYRNRLAEVLAREMRLEAEYQGLEEPDFTLNTNYLEDGGLERHYAGQREMFSARRDVQEGRKEQLVERILQFGNQIAGVESQIVSKHEQLEFVVKELENVRDLNAEGLARESEVLELQRSESILLGGIAEHQTELARIRNSIRDTELEILQGDREFKEQVVTELREATASREELVLQIVTAEKQLERIEILAPVDGIVHELQAFTLGGVVAPEATIVQIVPLSEGVEFELRVDPQSIDQVFVGQTSKVIFPAFNMRTTPELFGNVSGISPTSLTDPATGIDYFRVELTLEPEELARLGAVELIPGMPVEAFLQTGERSVLTYLTKPLFDQVKRAFREG
ncbi:HlyD family type I secretion periplasmic adaptor subunit [Pseudohalocynthiibacter sp. F2068]|jgi:membrane fusion protein, type I secretion system|uniref:HlyD family type I secretion periplasmic adaptor subunit n=1 Tax=Pseudohalocynthiibacter sp. F2068 TaxID=2926418 RepID=UPI001FF2A7C0|nr:HlyD family type I secretion periplasmic adaptor subunit [Pseudohalocynthiibacter sp. F2068]MCK0103874.1 HlyD family type I secretion periplasmic adaptor subunit [Pseudohalocynthiibacter sp. F2068]